MPGLLLRLLADLPNYGQWLPGSDDFGANDGRRATRWLVLDIAMPARCGR